MVRQQPIHDVEELLHTLVAAQILAALPQGGQGWVRDSDTMLS